MSDSDEYSSDEWLESECESPQLEEAAKSSKNDSLPSKSKKIYDSTYDTFVKWKQQHETKSTSESIVMAYFKELSKKYKPSTLWSTYSMLKATLKIREQIEIDNYHNFKAFMKKQSAGFTSKQSKVLSSEDIEKFLAEAPNNNYLATKVALIFGICGACRNNELVNIKLENIKKQGDLLVVNLPNATTKKRRTFVIAEEFTKVLQQYTDLRPKNATTDRFFVNFQNGKCTQQVIGKHKFAKMPKEIAVFLKLENPSSYTGHAFRRTSATLLANSGANIITLKRHGGWTSKNVAKGYIKESVKNKSKIGKIISTAVNFSSARSSEQDTNAPLPKRQRIETVTSETMPSEAQSGSDIDTNLSTGRKSSTFIFNKCSVVISHK